MRIWGPFLATQMTSFFRVAVAMLEKVMVKKKSGIPEEIVGGLISCPVGEMDGLR